MAVIVGGFLQLFCRHQYLVDEAFTELLPTSRKIVDNYCGFINRQVLDYFTWQ